MRTFLNAILSFIGSESLTDEEFASLSTELTADYTLAVYTALKTVLTAREGVSAQLAKLKAYFQAKGVDTAGPAREAASQIFLGSPL